MEIVYAGSQMHVVSHSATRHLRLFNPAVSGGVALAVDAVRHKLAQGLRKR